MSDPSSRMLRLLSLLQTHRHWMGTDLAIKLGVTPRTVRRDVERLRELGYIVEATRGTAGGYQLQAGTEMPPLLLDDDEAVAIAVGLRSAATGTMQGIEETSVRALAKLEQVLPARLRSRVGAFGAFTTQLPIPGPSIDANLLVTLALACRDHERLRCSYTKRDAQPESRVVEPHGLVSIGRRWYLVAWDVARRDWRTFRVDRMTDAVSTGAQFEPRALPAADPAAYVTASIAGMPDIQAVVVLHAPESEVRERLWPTMGTLEPLSADSCILRSGACSLDWLALSIASLGFDFSVQEPQELRDHLSVLSSRLREAAR